MNSHMLFFGTDRKIGNTSFEEMMRLLSVDRGSHKSGACLSTPELARLGRSMSDSADPSAGHNAPTHPGDIVQGGVLTSIVLGKNSGRHAFRQALEEMGFILDSLTLRAAYERFKEVASRQKTITAMDLEALVADEFWEGFPEYMLNEFEVNQPTAMPAEVWVAVRMLDGNLTEGSSKGEDVADAACRAIQEATGFDADRCKYRVGRVRRQGPEALAEVAVSITMNGQIGSGEGTSANVAEAAALACLQALSEAVCRANQRVFGTP